MGRSTKTGGPGCGNGLARCLANLLHRCERAFQWQALTRVDESVTRDVNQLNVLVCGVLHQRVPTIR